MRRRDLIAGLVAATAAGSGLARAQQPERMRRLGVLMPWPEHQPNTQARVKAFTEALGRLGWIEGRNIRIDYRFAAGDPALFKAYAAELVALSPDAILASTPPAVVALEHETHSIPIVFVLVVDPVGIGLVQSLARPGGMITGFGASETPLMGKWLQLLKEIDPPLTRVLVIFNPDTQPYAKFFNRDLTVAASSVGLAVTLAPVHDAAGIEAAIIAEGREAGGGLIALPDAFNVTHHNAIIAAALRQRLPLIGFGETFPQDGALMSYWLDEVATHAQAASYIDRILRGASPADLPVQEPTRYLLIINLKTAKALDLTVPQSILQRADDVIE
jgi:putative tryptophan/tyrosine transport system substrate-binding protein